MFLYIWFIDFYEYVSIKYSSHCLCEILEHQLWGKDLFVYLPLWLYYPDESYDLYHLPEVILYHICLFQVDSGLKDDLVLGDPTAPRFVLWGGGLKPVPSGLSDLPFFDLMSFPGKLRAGFGALGFRPAPPVCTPIIHLSFHSTLAIYRWQFRPIYIYMGRFGSCFDLNGLKGLKVFKSL